jgi:membrane-associated protease RseP (regulator of RpoE activity)
MLTAQNDQYDQYTQVVSRFFNIDDVTWGDNKKKKYLVRYRGQLRGTDSAQAYEQLAQVLRRDNITPLFRLEGKNQVVLLINGIIQPKPTKVWGNIVAFTLTILSVMFVGATSSATSMPSTIAGWFTFMLAGLPYAFALLAILVCHEFGHYLAGRFHKTAVTLPFFIPLPIGLGTLGAFIQLKEPPKNKRILLDIGLAGPLAGLVVAIPFLIYGLYSSPVEQLPVHLPLIQGFEGNSIFYLFIKYIVKGQLLPQPATYAGVSPFIYWIRYFFTGRPLPAGGLDVTLNPFAWAGWVGLLVTSLNLIPAGQLDGGHIMYVLLGRRTSKLLPYILIVLVALSFVYTGWLLWAFLIFLLGRYHAEPLDEITPLDPKRRAMAVLGVIIFILVFMPVPFA